MSFQQLQESKNVSNELDMLQLESEVKFGDSLMLTSEHTRKKRQSNIVNCAALVYQLIDLKVQIKKLQENLTNTMENFDKTSNNLAEFEQEIKSNGKTQFLVIRSSIGIIVKSKLAGRMKRFNHQLSGYRAQESQIQSLLMENCYNPKCGKLRI